MKPDMNNTIALLKDNHFFADLLNGPCKPMADKTVGAQDGNQKGQRGYLPINPDWIDEDMSERLTGVFHRLFPEEMPFTTLVRVVKNPDVLLDGVAVDDGTKRTRYIVVTVVQDAEYPYDMNFPLILTMGIVSLSAWELTRSTIAASEAYANVMLTKFPVPPILNNAIVEWVSLYVGKDGYKGPRNLRDMAFVDEAASDDLEMDTHLYDLRTVDNPLAQRLLDAVNEDSLPHPNQGNN